MQLLKQTKSNNCLATCVACLLDLAISDVPEFQNMKGQFEWHDAILDFLDSKGYEYGGMAQHWNIGDETGIDGFLIVFGKSPRGSHSHAVIYKDGALFHDPHPDNTGIVGEPEFFIINRKS